MPKCQNCRKLYHPDYVVVVDTTLEGKDLVKCVFCKTLKDELTISGKDGKSQFKVTKKEANLNYLRHLRELSDDEGISKLLVKGKNS